MSTDIHTWTTNNFVTSTTNILPSQTTPFAPASTCTGSIYCEYKASQISTASFCWKWDRVDVSHNVPFQDNCYPDGQDTHYWGIWMPRGYYGSGSWDEITTLAYPGWECPIDWAAACTRTLIVSDAAYTQTWCCPESSFTCALGTRRCYSLLSTPTTVWIMRETETKGSDGEWTLFSQYEVENRESDPITIAHYPFPLQAEGLPVNEPTPTTLATETRPTGSGGNTSTATNDSPTPHAEKDGLSKGAEIATIIGSILAFLGLIVAVAGCLHCCGAL